MLRMDITALSLLLLVQLPTIFASGFLIQSEVCGDFIAYSTSPGDELFYINGNSVDKYVFCEALQRYHANGCTLEGHPGSNRCHLDLLTGMI